MKRPNKKRRAELFSVVGNGGRFTFEIKAGTQVRFLTAAKAIGEDPSILLLGATALAIEQVIAVAAARQIAA